MDSSHFPVQKTPGFQLPQDVDAPRSAKNVLLMVQKSQTTTWDLGCKKNLMKNVISTTNLNW